MTKSDTLSKEVERGRKLRPPPGNAELGYFEDSNGRMNADNVFVLFAHYAFKDGLKDWPRKGNDEDIANLDKTFAGNRKCAFRAWSSPVKEDLLALLGDEQLLKRYFASEGEPSVFILIISSHGASEGTIYTDTKFATGEDDYVSFKIKEVFAKLKETFPKSRKLLFLGPCRGELTSSDGDENPSENQATATNYPSRVSYEPKMHNTDIFYSTVETTNAGRDCVKGTWFVRCLCDRLNFMTEDESIATFSTGMQHGINELAVKAPADFKTGEKTEQTMESKMYPHDRKFVFSAMDDVSVDTSGTTHDESKNDLHWKISHTESVCRGKLAAIFHEGVKDNAEIKKLEDSLIKNLKFETTIVELESQSVDKYFLKLKEKSWSEYGCFAAFFFAQVEEENNQVCIKLNGNEKRQIGELINTLLGSESKEWQGKPKLFFLIDVNKTAAEDSKGRLPRKNKINFPEAFPHSYWMLIIIQMRDLPKLLGILEGQDIKGEKNLQDCLSDRLLVCSKEETPRALLISALPRLMYFPDEFVQPRFGVTIGDGKRKYASYDKLIQLAKNFKNHKIWILSGQPGFGKTTALSEIYFELRRSLSGVKIFKFSLMEVDDTLFEGKKGPTLNLVSFISSCTKVAEDKIKYLVKHERIILMFDEFDEIGIDVRGKVLNWLKEAAESKVTIWISTRLAEREEIIEKLSAVQQICKATVQPLAENKQIELLKILSMKDEECKALIEFFKRTGSAEILGSPLNLQMIAQLDQENKFLKSVAPNLYNIYDDILHRKIRNVLTSNYIENSTEFKKKRAEWLPKLQNISIQFLEKTQSTNESWHSQAILTIREMPRNGILTYFSGRIKFVHQTYPEFLAAQCYITALEDADAEMPFELFHVTFRQVRKFVDIKISETSDGKVPRNPPCLISKLRSILNESFSKEIASIVIEENLLQMLSLVHLKHFRNKDLFSSANLIDLFEKACALNEDFALELCSLVAFDELSAEAVKNMLESAIKKDFARIFPTLYAEYAKMERNLDVESINRIRKFLKSAVSEKIRDMCHDMLKLVIECKLIDPRSQEEALKIAVNGNYDEHVRLLVDDGAPTSFLKFIWPKPDETYTNMEQKTAIALLRTKTEPPEELALRLFGRALVSGSVAAAQDLQEKHGVVERATFHKNASAINVTAGIDDVEKHSAVLELCRWLVEECGMKIEDENDDEWNGLHCAAKAGNFELVKYFLEKNPGLISSVTKIGNTALHCATYSKNFSKETLEYLHGQDSNLIKKTDNMQNTALHGAAGIGFYGAVLWNIENGAELDAVNGMDRNVAHRAIMAWSGDEAEKRKILDYLHSKNRELFTKKDIKGYTVSHLAVLMPNKIQSIEWLMEKGLDSPEKDSKGMNYFHLASYRGNVGVFKLITEKRPNLIESLTSDDENAMHLLVASSNTEVTCDTLKYLHQLNPELVKRKTKAQKTVLHYAMQKNGNEEIVKWLVDDIRLEVDAEDENGWNALHFAVASFKSNPVTENYLMGKNSNLILQKTKKEETPLHIAAINGRIENFKRFVQYGVDPRLKDKDGKPAIGVAKLDDVDKLEQIFAELKINAD